MAGIALSAKSTQMCLEAGFPSMGMAHGSVQPWLDGSLTTPWLWRAGWTWAVPCLSHVLTCIILNPHTSFSSPVLPPPPPLWIALTLSPTLLQGPQTGGFCTWRRILLTVNFTGSFSHTFIAKTHSWKAMWVTQVVRGVQKRARSYQTAFVASPNQSVEF